MAEPAAVLAIVNELAKTANFCFQIIKKASNAPDEIKRLNAEISNWRPQLESLWELLNSYSQSATRLRDKFKDGALAEVENLVNELNCVLEQYQNPNAWKKFKWSITTGDQVKDLLSQLQRDIGLILGNLHIENHLSLVGLHKEIRQIQLLETNEHERRNILEWLRPPGIDAHEFHRQKRALREEGTCNWLADSSAWEEWCEGGSEEHARFLWIHGLPGAGKTVLASFAIDDVTSKYQHKGVSYFYCSHERHKKGHTSTEEACSFLRWVIRDLTAQVTRPMTRASNRQATIPKTLENMYVEHDFTISKLLECLLAVTEYITAEFSQQVCIIVDAVDESPSPRDALLKVLTTIGTDPEWHHVSLCFTSRKELDIARAIEAIQPPKSPKPSQPSRSFTPEPPQRTIIVPKSPAERLKQKQKQRGVYHGVNPAGFDGGPSSIQEMGPPPLPQEGNVRGRPPSGSFTQFPNSAHRVCRSVESGRRSGSMSSPEGGRERASSAYPTADSRGNDPMDLDPPALTVPRAVKEGCTILSMDENPNVREAIRTFLRNQLKENDMFRHRQRDLEEVISLIARKAKGMFRWAACQVDIIIRSSLCDMDSISDLLEQVPSDIFGTYEHMISQLLPNGQGENELNRNFARTALALICSESSAVPCAQVLVHASRFSVITGRAHTFKLEQLEKILGCLITVTSLPRLPKSLYSHTNEDSDAMKQVSVAHYTVKEFLFDLFEKKNAPESVKEFALSTEVIQSLELQVIFSGLQQFGSNRNKDGRWPTRYEEYCLKMTDKALKDRRDLIIRDENVWKNVTECLTWNSPHHQSRFNAFPNMRTRAAFPSWTKTSPFDQGNEPRIPETSVLVSLLLLQWPELAKLYLADLPESTKREIWKDNFELAKAFKVDGTNPTSLMQACVTRRDVDFLTALIDSRADFSGETDLVLDVFYNAYGHPSLDDEDGGAKTGKMLKMLLERGVRPEAPGYVFTPLQFAVSNLEESWVYDLLYEGADPNAIGSKNGVHPFGENIVKIKSDSPPLEICKSTRPDWLKSATPSDPEHELMEDARQRVELTLRQWGAQDLITHPIVVPDDDDDDDDDG